MKILFTITIILFIVSAFGGLRSEMAESELKMNTLEDFPTYPSSYLILDFSSTIPGDSLKMRAWSSDDRAADVIVFYEEKLTSLELEIRKTGLETEFLFKAPFTALGLATLVVGPAKDNENGSTILLILDNAPRDVRLNTP